ncbi:MAG: hypothetical protein QXH56_07430 [Thermoprotei archaeon]
MAMLENGWMMVLPALTMLSAYWIRALRPPDELDAVWGVPSGLAQTRIYGSRAPFPSSHACCGAHVPSSNSHPFRLFRNIQLGVILVSNKRRQACGCVLP